MCGIVGYIGGKSATPFLLEGLRRLEYRGYDSAGVASLENEAISVTRAVGRIEKLSQRLEQSEHHGLVGIGHTRWATHGPATEENAHPHLGGDNRVAIVHNGVIENYEQLRTQLEAKGVVFRSATDTEVVVQLIEQHLPAAPLTQATLAEAVEATIKQLRGTYGLVVLCRDAPDVLIAARLGSPLVVGVGKGEHFLASDAAPLAGYTDKIVYLADQQLAVLTADSLDVRQQHGERIRHQVERLAVESNDVDLGDCPHYMLKEILEQPESLRNAMRGRLSDADATAVFGGLNLRPQQLRRVDRMILTACGTSWHAAMLGEYMMEEMARVPVEVEYASELRYRNPPLDNHTLLFAITQSGETADTLAALREMKRKGHPTLAICNVVGSSIAQEADGGIYLHAGPEIGVASTKAYTSQCAVLAMLALYFGRLNHLSFEQGQEAIEQLRQLPDEVAKALQANDEVRRIAEKYKEATNYLYLGRQYNFPTALEGALKLKEISYVHAEGYPAAEMKHGPIALVDEKTPSVFIIPRGTVYDKVMANLEEVKARGGPVIAICSDGDERVARIADDIVHVPHVAPWLQPIVSVVPLQLLAYHVALLRGCDVDKPRNLAKSVTVE